MSTFFDVLTVACFVALVIVFVRFTDKDGGTLLRFSVSGIGFATANQLGNNGHDLFAWVLIVGAAGFAWLSVVKVSGG